MVDRSVFERALDDLRFDEAEEMIGSIEGTAARALHAEMTQRRVEAESRAQERYRQIVQLGRERRHSELLHLAQDPSTRPLLRLLSPSYAERAELHLRAAERWESTQRETSLRRLVEARKALDGLDLELARGLAKRVDQRFLTDEEAQELDQLLLDISARSIEVETLDDTGRRLLDEAETESGDDSTNRTSSWWRRWLGG